MFQTFFKEKFQEELDTHSELRELENGGKSGSAAPSGASETPQPSGTRIKIISNSAREKEASSSAEVVPKEEE